MIKSNPDLRGKPEEILKIMDRYKADKFLMTVGDAKRVVITDLIKERKPKVSDRIRLLVIMV
jgi:predicted phage gp36 major capsid-like protein